MRTDLLESEKEVEMRFSYSTTEFDIVKAARDQKKRRNKVSDCGVPTKKTNRTVTIQPHQTRAQEELTYKIIDCLFRVY